MGTEPAPAGVGEPRGSLAIELGKDDTGQQGVRATLDTMAKHADALSGETLVDRIGGRGPPLTVR